MVDREWQIVVWREGSLDWRWYVHNWLIDGGKPWWAKPNREGAAMTESGALRQARKAVRDLTLREETRREVTA